MEPEGEAEAGEEAAETRSFVYKFSSNGTKYSLRVPVPVPLGRDKSRELASRLVQAHHLPCYLEDDLCSQLELFSREEALRSWDEEGDRVVAGGSVQGADTDQTISQWVVAWSNHCSQFSNLQETPDPAIALSEVYHTLIHSPALETLLQLEHKYALAVETSVQAWKNAREVLTKRHDAELKEAMRQFGSSKSERDISQLMRQHETERMVLEAQWSGELRQQQNTQKKGYRQWMDGVYEEMTSSGGKKSKQTRAKRAPDGQDRSGGRAAGGEGSVEQQPAQAQPLEESFTIHLGAQLKSSHNIRLLCGSPLGLCHQKTAPLHSTAIPHPEKLQTAMSLYSNKLSCMVLMLGRDISNPTGVEAKFADICQRSTEFHFPDYSEQMSRIVKCTEEACEGRSHTQYGLLESSFSSQTSESQSRGGSPFESPEKGLQSIPENMASGSFLSPPPSTSGSRRGSANEANSSRSRREGWGDSGERRRSSGADSMYLSPPLEESETTGLEPGDFFVTRHSNLSQVHMVLHLVTDPTAVLSSGLRARHPVLVGLKNCLRMAARNDVHHITLPLLLVHGMTPEMTITWCVRRAELVFKCVKGFMLENPTWGDGDSRTIQFLIPPSISQDLFEEFCDMLPKIFRITTARKLISRTRAHSYK